MDADLVALQRKKRLANNNLAGATWEDSISGEMQAIAARYRAGIEVEQAKIVDLRKRMSDMESAY